MRSRELGLHANSGEHGFVLAGISRAGVGNEHSIPQIIS